MSNGTSTIEEFINTTLTSGDNFQPDSRQQQFVFAKYEFVQTNPWLAFPVVLVLFAASLVGTSGNILIFLSVLFYKKVRTVESTFIVNLALSDMFVTLIADPFSIVGTCKLLGKHVYTMNSDFFGCENDKFHFKNCLNEYSILYRRENTQYVSLASLLTILNWGI